MLVSELYKVFEDSVYYNLNVEERDLSSKVGVFDERHYITNRYGDNIIDEKYFNDEVIWCDIERNGKRNVLNVGTIHYINEEAY